MRRRTSLPRLKIISSKDNATTDAFVPPTPSIARPKTGIPALTVESLVARNREAGAPLNSNSGEADEEFPYQCGPKEILPGLFLGSEQNAKDPTILKELGITQVICCAKEVACPWLLEEVPQDERSSDGSAIATSASTFGHLNRQQQEPAEDSSRNGDNNERILPAYLTLPSPSIPSLSPAPSQRLSRTSSPSRPLFLRPAVSTPNLKEKKRPFSINALEETAHDSTSNNSTSNTIVSSTPASRISISHSGYLHRNFPANRSSGRPALQYIKLPWGHDEDDVAKHFETYQICELVDKARQDGGRCLVHCQLGVSRSATLMIGYCMRQAFRKNDLQHLEDVKSMHDSYTFVRAKSRWVAPNIGLLVSCALHLVHGFLAKG